MTSHNKVIIPTEVTHYFEKAETDLPNITGMCTTNLLGNSPPLFILLKGLKKLPAEFEILVATHQINVASSPNGWMNRSAFLMWTLNFVCWLQMFRTTLPPGIKYKPAVLLLDGHNSRENPLAMEILKKSNVHIIVLPAHTTHVLQLFDVSLASPLKKKFTELFKSLLRNPQNIIPGNETATLRKNAIEAFLVSWKTVCNLISCKAAALSVGYEIDIKCSKISVKEEIPLRNKWVKPVLTPEEEEAVQKRSRAMVNRLNINNNEITTDEAIQNIRAALEDNRPVDAQVPLYQMSLQQIDSFERLVEIAFDKGGTTSMLGTSQTCGVINLGSFC